MIVHSNMFFDYGSLARFSFYFFVGFFCRWSFTLFSLLALVVVVLFLLVAHVWVLCFLETLSSEYLCTVLFVAEMYKFVYWSNVTCVAVPY